MKYIVEQKIRESNLLFETFEIITNLIKMSFPALPAETRRAYRSALSSSKRSSAGITVKNNYHKEFVIPEIPGWDYPESIFLNYYKLNIPLGTAPGNT